jgi:two-component system chemotaxis response regulator CheB
MDTDSLRVLVVDDSAYNRQTITAMLEELDGVSVVGRATNGKEALRLAYELEPDCITLDLEMPEMDGFSFLRLLMAKRPTPVIVISGYANRDNVFRALELGALDFIAKPSRQVSPDIVGISDQVVEKIAVVRRLRSVSLRLKARAESFAQAVGQARGQAAAVPEPPKAPEPPLGPPATELVVVGSSTGGPPAIQQLLTGLGRPGFAIAIAQHMPARFTAAFAARLDRALPIPVVEATDGQPLASGVVYIAPGEANLEIEAAPAGTQGAGAVLRVVKPTAGVGPVITPSADHLFKSAASVFGRRLCAVVLTGMGSDGTKGAAEVRKHGGRVVVEDPKTAVMPGMPQSVSDAGFVDDNAPIERLSVLLTTWAAGLSPSK